MTLSVEDQQAIKAVLDDANITPVPPVRLQVPVLSPEIPSEEVVEG